jgi:hypothetical protein
MHNMELMGLDGAPIPTNLALGFAGSSRQRRFTRRKKMSIVGLVALIIIALIILPSIINGILPGEHTSNLERSASSEDEMRALRAAEKMDMAQILGIDRFCPSMEGGYLWSNVTDGETIRFYKDRIDQLDKEWDQNDAMFEYTATCHSVDQLLLNPNVEYDNYRQVYTIASNNNDADYMSSYRYIDLEGLPMVDENYVLEDAYVIRQNLRYEEQVGSYDLSNEISQLVVLDVDHQVRVLMVYPQYRTIPLCY